MRKVFLVLMIMAAAVWTSGQVYHVGDLYTAENGSQGIVYYVLPDGGCWVVALEDSPMHLKWGGNENVPAVSDYGCDSANIYSIYPLQALADTAGYSNTMAISNFFNNVQNVSLGVDIARGWYVPSVGQLSILFAQIPFIESALIDAGGSLFAYDEWSIYWSSTEHNTYQAWTVHFSLPTPSSGFLDSQSGALVPYSKTNVYHLRAIRSIPPPQNYYDTTYSYLWNTGDMEPHIFVSPDQTTNYSVTVSNAYGCSNSASVAIMVIDGVSQTLYDTICKGSSYSNYGFTLTGEETASIEDTILTRTVMTSGCESEITLYLTLLDSDTVEIEQSATEPSFVWNDVTYTEDGVYIQYFNNQYGCDSTVILTLSFDGSIDPNLELPDITITPDCQNVEFSWVFSSDSAAAATNQYYIYYKPTLAGTFTCIDSFDNTEVCFPEPCIYNISGTGSQVLVGCYAMCVSDSHHNFTEISDSACIDVFNCLDYRLPNVFTPNGDGINDLFFPFMPYSGVTKVEMEIYNRWGKRVFHTENPDILWDGIDESRQLPSSDGVYYYSCKLCVNTLAGEVYYLLNGSVTLIR